MLSFLLCFDVIGILIEESGLEVSLYTHMSHFLEAIVYFWTL